MAERIASSEAEALGSPVKTIDKAYAIKKGHPEIALDDLGPYGVYALRAETAKPTSLDLGRRPALWVVSYSHPDTRWRWDYGKTNDEYLPNTMRDNVALFEKYPHDILNFSGSNGYRTMKDDTPADHGQVKTHVAAVRRLPAGSSAEERDLNAPSARTCAEPCGIQDCHPRIRR